MLEVDFRQSLSASDFCCGYANKRPAVVRGARRTLFAVSRWSIDYVRIIAPNLPERLKVDDLKGGRVESIAREKSLQWRCISAPRLDLRVATRENKNPFDGKRHLPRVEPTTHPGRELPANERGPSRSSR